MRQKLKDRRVALDVKFSGDVPPLLFDAHQLQQVFVNLLLNAAEAMPGGGTIVIRGKKEEGAESGNAARGFLITIQDSGIGIAPDKIKRIFEPFFTTKLS